MSPLRARLREDTRPEHDRLDALYGQLDLSVRDDYLLFLQAHHAAHSVVEPLIQPAPARQQALAADIRALGAVPLAGFAASYTRHAHPLGLSYVVAGSFLGGQVLRKAWELSRNDTMRSAGRHFGLSGLREHWQTVLKSLTDVAAEDQHRVVDGARAGFRCFADALHFAGRR